MALLPSNLGLRVVLGLAILTVMASIPLFFLDPRTLGPLLAGGVESVAVTREEGRLVLHIPLGHRLPTDWPLAVEVQVEQDGRAILAGVDKDPVMGPGETPVLTAEVAAPASVPPLEGAEIECTLTKPIDATAVDIVLRFRGRVAGGRLGRAD